MSRDGTRARSTLGLSVANAPTSWGIDPPEPANDPPWQTVLDEIEQAGYQGTELGPLGYLPSSAQALSDALRARGLSLAAGFVMAPFTKPSDHKQIEAAARRTCELLTAGGAGTLILIDALAKARNRTAGRSERAHRLGKQTWTVLMDGLVRAAEVAMDFGLRAVIHPHVGTHIEFEDEVERVLADTDSELLGLCVDTGHSTYAGIDPSSLLHRHAERVSYVHLKDIDEQRLAAVRQQTQSFSEAVATGIFRPLGEGCVDFPAVVSELMNLGYRGWATVEQDGSANPFEEARRSLEYLRNVGLAG